MAEVLVMVGIYMTMLLVALAALFFLWYWYEKKGMPEYIIGIFSVVILVGYVFAMVTFTLHLQDSLETDERDLAQQVQEIVGETVKLVEKNQTGIYRNAVTGTYEYLGAEKMYKVTVDDKEVQAITSGDTVVYRNLEGGVKED